MGDTGKFSEKEARGDRGRASLYINIQMGFNLSLRLWTFLEARIPTHTTGELGCTLNLPSVPSSS